MDLGRSRDGQAIRSAGSACFGATLVAFCAAGILQISGCARSAADIVQTGGTADSPYVEAATRVEYPELDEPIPSDHSARRPLSLTLDDPLQYEDMTLERTVQVALQNSKIFRDLGGLVLRSPAGTRSTMDPAVVETDPRFGIQAAMSNFDATFATSLFYENNDRALNNVFFGGGTRILRQHAAVFQSEINKRTPYGSEYSVRHNVKYDENNAPGNAFYSAWEANFELEYRQSLLKGGGLDFNRIAGASRIPGVYTGVLIARANADISLADFELACRDFISEVENGYWDLYYAYRDLDAKIAARNSALETWRRVAALQEKGRVGGEADKEAEAREQFYRFQEDVENTLAGRLTDGTRANNGTAGGTFRPTAGVQVAERRLRYLIGLPVTDGSLLRPVDEPPRAMIVFDWDMSLSEGLTKRTELRRQKWLVKRREMELLASRNYLLPQLDAVAQYRIRGLGDDLLDPQRSPDPFNSAYQNLTGGDYQEWQFGGELSFPFGNRQGHAAVRNAEFLLAREQAVLHEQEKRVVHDLSNAMADTERAFRVVQTVYNRRSAAKDRVSALQAAFEADKAPLNLVLDAQRRLAAADSHYYDALVDYGLSIRNMHFEKGTLLEYVGVALAEGPWPEIAIEDGRERQSLRVPARFSPPQRTIATPVPQ
ncbi:TolC family protein [Planctomyces sp. SH-PL14]|uniref:TolC family protein n=1 Tax=Planctomyces sp. SH-PL14 TaxID=1632864 RepID=UPI00078C479A|nr:TolC family protein [Planctomyces sp. SH-PL14]AMV21417.1 Outer membrane efflux protein [Planctomyces sp. SH-PL14]